MDANDMIKVYSVSRIAISDCITALHYDQFDLYAYKMRWMQGAALGFLYMNPCCPLQDK